MDGVFEDKLKVLWKLDEAEYVRCMQRSDPVLSTIISYLEGGSPKQQTICNNVLENGLLSKRVYVDTKERLL